MVSEEVWRKMAYVGKGCPTKGWNLYGELINFDPKTKRKFESSSNQKLEQILPFDVIKKYALVYCTSGPRINEMGMTVGWINGTPLVKFIEADSPQEVENGPFVMELKDEIKSYNGGKGRLEYQLFTVESIGETSPIEVPILFIHHHEVKSSHSDLWLRTANSVVYVPRLSNQQILFECEEVKTSLEKLLEWIEFYGLPAFMEYKILEVKEVYPKFTYDNSK